MSFADRFLCPIERYTKRNFSFLVFVAFFFPFNFRDNVILTMSCLPSWWQFGCHLENDSSSNSPCGLAVPGWLERCLHESWGYKLTMTLGRFRNQVRSLFSTMLTCILSRYCPSRHRQHNCQKEHKHMSWPNWNAKVWRELCSSCTNPRLSIYHPTTQKENNNHFSKSELNHRNDRVIPEMQKLNF